MRSQILFFFSLSGVGFQAMANIWYCCCACMFSCVQLFATPWTVAHQAPLSVGFSKQIYWNGLPCLLQGIFPTQGSHLLCLLLWKADSLLPVPPGRSSISKYPVDTHVRTWRRDDISTGSWKKLRGELSRQCEKRA